MSKFCPFCDDVKDSELNTAEKFKEHIFEEHQDEIVETGEPERVDDHGDDKNAEKEIPAKFREVKESQ